MGEEDKEEEEEVTSSLKREDPRLGSGVSMVCDGSDLHLFFAFFFIFFPFN